MTKPVILFSLPRSGSTLLCGLLSQNPNFKIIEGSLTVSILNNLRSIFYTEAKSLATRQQSQCWPVLKSAICGYYGSDSSFVFDKNREALFYLDIWDQVLEEYKIVCLVRDPVECASSFLRLREKEPITWTKYDNDVVNKDTFPRTMDFAQCLMAANGTIGRSYSALYEAALVQNRHSDMLFVDYSNLCSQPKKQLDRICNFIGADKYYPQLNNIENANKQLDRYYGMFDTLHTIEPKIREAKASLGRLSSMAEDLRSTCPPFWQEWI